MADSRRFVDTSGSTPRVRWGVLAATLAGSVYLGWLDGLLEFIVGTTDGMGDAVGDLGTFIEAGLVPSAFGIVEGAIAGAWAGNAEFLSMFGVLAFPLAVLEVVVLIALFRWGIGTALTTVKGAFA